MTIALIAQNVDGIINMARRFNHRMYEGAAVYARADRSDPFSYARALAHIKSGVASVSNDKGQPAYYDAEPVLEHREYSHEGRVIKYTVPAYINMVRP